MPRAIKPLTASLHTVRVVRALAKVIRAGTRVTLTDDLLAEEIYRLLGNTAPTDASLTDEVITAIRSTQVVR